ncbi:MAG: BCD family MFS transporter [Methylobacteriaceae bacterium]|nr:BCD family MFS transporter [Methylobacteriaceae bacterium]
MATSTLNRVMVVEAALPAIVPGLLVGLHYAVQVVRPRFGHGSDVGGRRTPWILGGMAVLGTGGALGAVATALMVEKPAAGIALAVLAFAMIGLGVGAAGTSLLVLMAARVAPRRRAAAATTTWVMMIAGFVLTTAIAGALLQPYSAERLVAVTGGVSLLAVLLATAAVSGIEGRIAPAPAPAPAAPASRPAFREALAEVWAEPQARRFALFVFLSMLAYSAQDLVLEPFAGAVFGLPPGATTQLAAVQHGGVLVGMILVALAGTLFPRRALGELRVWAFGGCLASALGTLALVGAALLAPDWPLRPTVFANGVANGAFAVAAIGSMMQLVGRGRASREGVRMGLWGGAQAVAFGLGGCLGAGLSDLGRIATGSAPAAYAAVFLVQAILFVGAAILASRVFEPAASGTSSPADLAAAASPLEVRS